RVGHGVEGRAVARRQRPADEPVLASCPRVVRRQNVYRGDRSARGIAVATSPVMDTFTTITDDTLARIAGGMRLDDVPLSTNIEDRRGETAEESVRPRPLPPPLPPSDPNNPLARDLGINDIGIPRRRG